MEQQENLTTKLINNLPNNLLLVEIDIVERKLL